MTSLTIVIPTTGRPSLRRAVWSAAAVADQVIVVADGCEAVTDADLTVSGVFGAPGRARNGAAPYVGCEWVGFLDDDDELLPAYREQVDAHAGADMIVHTMHDPDLGYVPRPDLPLMHMNVGISFTVRADLFRQQRFIAGPPETMRGEDFEYVRRFMDQNRVIVRTNVVAYRVLPEELSR